MTPVNRHFGDDPERALELAQNRRQHVVNDEAFTDRMSDFAGEPLWRVPFSREDFLNFKARMDRLDREGAAS